jgi:WD40 repeat protein/transcriptional regulator with XRE-family HTH domain
VAGEQIRESFQSLLLRYRGRTGLTQRQLAERVGVNMRSVQGWEGGVSYPTAEALERLILVYLEAGVFAPGREAAAAEAFWSQALDESPRQRPPFDRLWFAELLARRGSSEPPTRPAVPPGDRPALARLQDWGDAPDTVAFVGRGAELATLAACLGRTTCRLVALLGIGGVGKTTLASRLARDLAPSFERVFWRSARNAPPLNEWLAVAIGFLSGQELVPPEGEEARLLALLRLLRDGRSLLIIDNFESLLEPGSAEVGYRAGSAGYGALLRLVAETTHHSCLIITSREPPPELAQLGTSQGQVEVLQVGGLGVQESRALLSEKQLSGSDAAWAELVGRYAGNGLALKIVAESIRQVFASDIDAFLEEASASIVFGGVRRLLETQLERLSDLERQVLDWLAIERGPMSFGDLSTAFGPSVRRGSLLEAVETLRERSLIERSGPVAAFTLQTVVLEYVTERLIERVAEEIAAGQLSLLVTRALVVGQTKEYVRRLQERLIAQPLLHRLVGGDADDAAGVEQRLTALLDVARQRTYLEQGYAPGNVVNLLRLLRGHLRGLDLSGLSIRQAYLQDVEAQDANLAGAQLADTVLGDAFGAIGAVDLSADGQRVAAATLGGAVRVWRMSDRALLLAARGHTGAVWGVALSSDGHLLASGSLDGTLRVWDVETGARAAGPVDQVGGVARVALADDSRLLLTGGLDGSVRIWDAASGAAVRTLSGHTGAVYGVAASKAGQLLASGGLDGVVRLWDLGSGQSLAALAGHTGTVWGVAVSLDGNTVASCGLDGTVRLWDPLAREPIATLEGHTGPVRAVALSGNGQVVVSGGFDGTVRLWEARSGRPLATLQGHTGGVRGVAISEDGRTVASGGFDGTVRLWAADSGLPLATLQGHSGGIRGVAVSADANLIASSGPDAAVRVWDATSGKLLNTLEGHPGGVRAVAMRSDGRVIASTGLDCMVRLWDGASGQPLRVLAGHTAATLAVALSADGNTVASGGLDGTLRLWDAQRGQSLAVLEGHSGAIWYVASSGDGSAVASCGLDGTARVWDTGGGQILLTLQGHAGGVRSVALSAGIVATGADDATVRVWDGRDGRCLAVLTGHTAAVYGVAASADGRRLVSGSLDGSVRLWDSASGRCLATLEGHADAVSDVAISADGRTVVSGSLDATVRVWDAAGRAARHTLRPDRRYERMDITGLTGITDAQRATLVGLGAVVRG